MKDIIQLPVNISGSDFVIGDVHGCPLETKRVIDILNVPGHEHDRLFFVGDLIDRGPDSLAAVLMVMDAAEKFPDRVYVTFGNHEESFLQVAMSAKKSIESLRHIPELLDDAICKIIENKLHAIYSNLNFYLDPSTGGSWVCKKNTSVLSLILSLFAKTDTPEKLNNFRDSVIKLANEPLFIDELYKIKTFFESLPSIILVGDVQDKKNSFIVCHADMPLSDNELIERLEKNPTLTNAEKQRAYWARPDPTLSEMMCNAESGWRYPHVRTVDSVLVYVGHNVVDNKNNASAVRYKTNTVNIDFGAFINARTTERNHFGLLVVNHTNATAVLYAKDWEKSVPSVLSDYLIEFRKKFHLVSAIEKYMLSHPAEVFKAADIKLAIINHERGKMLESLQRQIKRLRAISANIVLQKVHSCPVSGIFKMPVPEKKILEKALEGKESVTFGEIEDVLCDVQWGCEKYRIHLLFDPLSYPEKQQGVDNMIRDIAHAFLSEETQQSELEQFLVSCIEPMCAQIRLQ